MLLKRKGFIRKNVKEPKAKRGNCAVYINEMDDKKPLKNKYVVMNDLNMSNLLFCTNNDERD